MASKLRIEALSAQEKEPPSPPTQELTHLEHESTFYRRRIFLHSFLIGFIILHFIGLLAMIFLGSSWLDFGIFALLLLLYFTSLYLNRRGETKLASLLTCYTFNGEFFYYFLGNLFQIDATSNIESALIMAFFMGLSSLLAGMLMSQQAIISFTALNGLLIGVSFFQVHETLRSALLFIVPTVGFTYLIGLISWLYQNSLHKVDHQLEVTRQELSRSQQQKALELERLVRERTAELSNTLQSLKETQQELRQAKERAEQASQAKSDFLSSMSHELRSPLNAILGGTEILQSEQKSLRASQTRLLNIMQQSGTHLLSLIEDILDLSKIEARKIDIYPTGLNLPYFLRGIVTLMSMRAERKKLFFLYHGDEDLPTEVLADEKRLRQILINLLDNAIKFTEQGQITFSVTLSRLRWAGVEQDSSHSTFRFEVTDTGVGMTEEESHRIFLPFEQAGDRIQRARGTGLGLAITQELVRLMGGEVQVKSQLGEGTTFCFDLTLPVLNTQAEEQLAKQVIGYQGAQKKILIIDDLLENRYILRQMLAPLGFTILEAKNGLEGVEKVYQESPDLVLTDLVMPVMNGFLAMRKIREFNVNLPIIAISASIMQSDNEQSPVTGSDAYLAKPIRLGKLLAQVAKLLQLEWIYR